MIYPCRPCLLKYNSTLNIKDKICWHRHYYLIYFIITIWYTYLTTIIVVFGYEIVQEQKLINWSGPSIE